MIDEWEGLPRPGTRVRMVWNTDSKDGTVVSVVQWRDEGKIQVEVIFDGWVAPAPDAPLAQRAPPTGNSGGAPDAPLAQRAPPTGNSGGEDGEQDDRGIASAA